MQPTLLFDVDIIENTSQLELQKLIFKFTSYKVYFLNFTSALLS